jgi:hypothetical protein
MYELVPEAGMRYTVRVNELPGPIGVVVDDVSPTKTQGCAIRTLGGGTCSVVAVIIIPVGVVVVSEL